jgi:streptogramin lyase
MWFTGYAHGIGTVDTTAAIPSLTRLPDSIIHSCSGIAATEDHVWYAKTYGSDPADGMSIFGVNPDGSKYATYHVPHDPNDTGWKGGAPKWLWAMTYADNGSIYFTEKYTGKIGCFQPSLSPAPCGRKGNLEAEWKVVDFDNEVDTEITDIVQARENLYFVDKGLGAIGCMSLTGKVSYRTYPPGEPVGVAAAPDGHVWFTAFTGNYLGRLNVDTAALDRQVTLPPGTGPFNITNSHNGDHALWFTARGSNQIGRMEFSVQFDEWTPKVPGEIWKHPLTPYPVTLINLDQPSDPSSWLSPPNAIAVGHDGRVWFSAEYHFGAVTPHPG